MAMVLETSPAIKNFPNIEPAFFNNIPIQIGTGKVTTKPEYAQYIEIDYEPWLTKEKFKKIERELLYPETVSRKVLELHKKTPAEIWEQKAIKKDSVYWSRNLDGDSYQFKNIDEDGDEYIESCGHFVEHPGIHKRNNAILKIRCKFLRDYKTSRGNYENTGNYYYESDKAHRQFLEEVEQKGLVRKAQPKKSTVEIKALDPIDQKDLVEPHNESYNEETGNYEILREDEL